MFLTVEETYTGATRIEEGILVISGSGSISDSTQVEVESAASLVILSETTLHNLTGSGDLAVETGTPVDPGLTVYLTEDATFAGSFSGPNAIKITAGSNTFTLSGTSTYTGDLILDSGTVYISGSIGSPDATAYVCLGSTEGAVLKGSGVYYGSVVNESSGVISHGSDFRIEGDIANFGLIDLGTAPVSTLYVGGNVLFESGSYLSILIGEESSLLSVSGSVIIDDNATLSLITEEGFDPEGSFTFITASSIEGTFTTVTLNGSTLNIELVYENGRIIGRSVPKDFDITGVQGNALRVAQAIQTTVVSGNRTLDSIALSLISLNSTEVANALNEMQPAQFKGLAISQENNVVKVQGSIGMRFQEQLDLVHCFRLSRKQPNDEINDPDPLQNDTNTCPREKKPVHIWVNGFGDILRQKSNFYADSPQVGY